jgi:hypothetical protein
VRRPVLGTAAAVAARCRPVYHRAAEKKDLIRLNST